MCDCNHLLLVPQPGYNAKGRMAQSTGLSALGFMAFTRSHGKVVVVVVVVGKRSWGGGE